MNIKENIRIAIFSIKSNLMRSLLTMLGIIIGVASVIAVITVGNGGRDYIVGMIRDMGSSAISITVNAANSDISNSDYITDDDINAIKSLDNVQYVSICIVTLSLVITGCGAKSTTCSFNETTLAILSKNGILTWNPVCHVVRYAPSRSITYAFDCGTILRFAITIINAITIIAKIT